jgi:hypothetical protein
MQSHITYFPSGDHNFGTRISDRFDLAFLSYFNMGFSSGTNGSPNYHLTSKVSSPRLKSWSSAAVLMSTVPFVSVVLMSTGQV